MVTLYEFNIKNLNGRAQIAWQGEHIATRTEGDQRILLFSLPDFYAEVFYDTINNEIIDCRGFTALHLLSPYIEIGPENPE
ncbi:hypothetical protein ABDD95_19265 [Mucilaginibacter sp. PAMB04274]|uniref:hypothetical protein n=1 Tax=Mucilaginibacter sp. PAMB04274 TaxID=3138568 RepID=UPI0031F63570